MNAGPERRAYLQLLLQTLLNEKQIGFVHRTTIQLYAQTNSHGQLKMIVNKKATISSVSAVRFEKYFYGQKQRYLNKLKMVGWNSLDILADLQE